MRFQKKHLRCRVLAADRRGSGRRGPLPPSQPSPWPARLCPSPLPPVLPKTPRPRCSWPVCRATQGPSLPTPPKVRPARCLPGQGAEARTRRRARPPGRGFRGCGALRSGTAERCRGLRHSVPEGETERTPRVKESNYNFDCSITPSKLEITESRACAHKHLIFYTHFYFMPVIKTASCVVSSLKGLEMPVLGRLHARLSETSSEERHFSVLFLTF